jgi:hypothetical protein
LGTEAQLIKEILGCPAAADVELIDGRKVIDRYRIGGLALRGQTRSDRLSKIAVRVVLRYIA